jgi:hypothetical protein
MRILPSNVVMVGPAVFHLNLYRGDTYAWRFALWADDSKTQPVDLTGVTAAAQIRDLPDGLNVIDMACTITPPNLIDMALTATDCATARPGGWDLQLTYSDGRVLTVLAGNVLVTGDITQ